MKYGIDNLIAILDDYTKETRRFTELKKDAVKLYKGDIATQKIAEYQTSMEQKTQKIANNFSKQLADIIAAVQKDQEVSKYLSDPGFGYVVQIVSAGGGQLDTDVLRSLVRPYLDDYIARQSLAAITKQHGRDPKMIGIVEDVDALKSLKEIERNAQHTFTGWAGNDIPMTSTPSVIEHQIKRVNAILEGNYGPDSVAF